MNVHFLVFFICLAQCTVAQESYSKVLDFYGHSTDAILTFSESEDGLYAAIAGRCDSFTVDCAYLAKFNRDEGDTLWTRRIEWLDPGVRSLGKNGDTLLMAGHNAPSLSHFYLYYMDLNGDSLFAVDLYPPEGYYGVRIAGVMQDGSTSYVYGTSNKDSSEQFVSLIFKVDQDGQLDTALVIDPGEVKSLLYDIDIDPNGHLTLLIDMEEWVTDVPNPYIIRRKRLEKYNSDLELIWSWQSSNDFPFSGTNVSRMEILVDGTMVLIAEDGSSFKEEIWGVDESGIKWRYSYPASNAVHQYIINLAEAANGDILGCGRLIDTGTFQGQNGYLFRMSATGEMLWERAIIDNRSEVPDSYNLSRFRDVIELPDGTILAGGIQNLWYFDEDGEPFQDIDAWLVRTDADGCIIEDCEYVQDFTTSIPVFSDVSRFEIFPNPAIDVLQLNWSAEAAVAEVLIFNALGELVDRQDVNGLTAMELSIHSLAKGMYFVSLRDEAGRMYTEKVVKE